MHCLQSVFLSSPFSILGTDKSPTELGPESKRGGQSLPSLDGPVSACDKHLVTWSVVQKKHDAFTAVSFGWSHAIYPELRSSSWHSLWALVNIIAVSYTHLDVYKRQCVCRVVKVMMKKV